MKLVVTEKAIAGRRIAKFLATSPVKEQKQSGAVVFEFEVNGIPYNIVPLRGHITDVDFPKNYAPWLGTDLKKLTDAEILYIEREKSIAALLRKASKGADEVIFATDADREGESIALEALNSIKKTSPDIKVTRALFSAITQEDINNAFANLGDLNFSLADSADARREIDLVWGAVLTRFLSLVSGRLGKDFLSAGRVQSPTLALIVKREKERMAFIPEDYFEVEAFLEKDKTKFSASHKEGRIKDKERAEKIASIKSNKALLEKIKTSTRQIKRPLPFSTTLFLRAATGIGVSAGKAMNIAEDLYQQGLISYPRTDNQTYPKTIDLKKILGRLANIEAFAYPVGKILQKKELNPTAGKMTTDHPPIHPVDYPKKNLPPIHWKIYELVCRRFFATLSDDAKTENISAEFNIEDEIFVARGQRYIELGWKEYYPYSKAEEMLLPALEKGDIANVLDIKMHSKQTQPPSRYSQGSLIKAMEDLGLGTKSTRHQIIQKLYYRNYLKGTKAIEPSKIAFAIVDALEKNAGIIDEPEMTAELENEMDKVAGGKKTKEIVVIKSRETLMKILTDMLVKKDDIGKEIRKALIEESMMFECTGENCDGHLMTRKGFSQKRFLGCSNYPKCTQSYPLPQQGRIVPQDRNCETCKAPIMKIIGKRGSFEMCINHKCKTKEDWKKNSKNKKGGKKFGKKK